tara:strand:+ start:668 stop:1363 length:696 start_codon:yes stop_codon:yes gene_type:complete
VRIVIIVFIISIFFYYKSDSLIEIIKNKNTLIIFLKEKLSIKSIKIENLKLIDKEKVLKKINIDEFNLISLDLKSLRNQILEINEVKSIFIEKQIDGHLKIFIEEKKPFVYWKVKGNKYLIDSKGDILNYNNYANKNLKIVTGQFANIHAKKIIKKIKLFPFLNLKFKSADFIENYRWDINLIDNIKVKLPLQGEEDKALEFLDKFIKDKKFDKMDIRVIDLRIIGRAFIK